ncbi:MAG TPA: PEP-CTERM sorting domain-containing protein [Gemmataceae bacterium]|nr:PEP-CTERM sorting domain-containing protein [Gemmataceae bacterium]
MTFRNPPGVPRHIPLWLALACAAVLTPAPAGAETIIATHPIAPPPLTANTDILLIQTTPSFSTTQVGLAGAPSLSGLAVQPGTGTVFASSGFGGPNPGSLFTLNPSTGAATLVGSTGFGAVPAITFDRNGTLFGSGGVAPTQPFPTAGNTLITIDPRTGAGHFVGPFGTGIDGMAGLAVDPRTGILYGIGAETPAAPGVFTNLFTINKQTGAATLLGPLQGLPDGAAPVGLAFDSAGVLFASLAGGAGLGLGPGAGEIGVVNFSNPNNITFTEVGQAPQGSVSDIGFLVPEPSSLALLAVGLGAMAGWRRWRKRKAGV